MCLLFGHRNEIPKWKQNYFFLSGLLSQLFINNWSNNEKTNNSCYGSKYPVPNSNWTESGKVPNWRKGWWISWQIVDRREIYWETAQGYFGSSISTCKCSPSVICYICFNLKKGKKEKANSTLQNHWSLMIITMKSSQYKFIIYLSYSPNPSSFMVTPITPGIIRKWKKPLEKSRRRHNIC